MEAVLPPIGCYMPVLCAFHSGTPLFTMKHSVRRDGEAKARLMWGRKRKVLADTLLRQADGISGEQGFPGTPFALEKCGRGLSAVSAFSYRQWC